jgi:hypothetical protein
MMKKSIIISLFLVFAAYMQAQELIYIDKSGVMRWEKDKSEIALFGANYCLSSACDYRAAGYVGGDRKQMIKEDLDHFKRMGWDALRLCFWGDYQNTDKQGNLLDNDHLDLLDYLIAEADKRGIYMLLSPIVTYSSQWPDIMADTTNTGFAKDFPKSTLIHNDEAIKAQENYWQQILNHRNRYTGRSLKDEPNILFVELINEPTQFPDDISGMIKYINRLCKAIKSTGCKKPTFYNVSQDFRVAPAIAKSNIQGSTYAWYPAALNSGRNYEGNGLLMVDRYEEMLNPLLSNKPKLVYEFDTSDMNDGYMMPGMVREFRRGGVQFATIFSYDMLRTAPMNLGWQAHYINMVYTPSKAVASMVSAEILRRIPRGKHFGYYPENNKFDDFRVSYDEQLSELNSGDMFYYSNTTKSQPKDKTKLMHIAGVGSSPVVEYSGTGIYFLDKLTDGGWQLEIYPDIMDLDDPFKMVNPHKTVRKSVYREREMKINLPELNVSVNVFPGKYTFKNGQLVEKSELPQKDFYQSKLSQWLIVNHTPAEFPSKKEAIFKCEVFGDEAPENVSLYIMLKPWGSRKIQMKIKDAFTYEAKVNTGELENGYYDYHFAVEAKDKTVLFPAMTYTTPYSWDYYKQETYKFTLLPEKMPLTLLDGQDDRTLIRYSRSFMAPEVKFKSTLSEDMVSGFELSVEDLTKKESYWYPCDATISHFIEKKMQYRNMKQTPPAYIRIRAYGLNGTDKAICNIVDKEGRGFGSAFDIKSEASDILIPVSSLAPVKAAMLPQDWPGVNLYWYPTSIKPYTTPLDWMDVKFVQVSLRDELYKTDQLKNKGIVIEKIDLIFE